MHYWPGLLFCVYKRDSIVLVRLIGEPLMDGQHAQCVRHWSCYCAPTHCTMCKALVLLLCPHTLHNVPLLSVRLNGAY